MIVQLKMLYGFIRTFLLLGAISLVSACATSAISPGVDPLDPFENSNRRIYDFNEGLDEHILKPIATRYADITPDQFKKGITNFFNNLAYVNVIANSSLQGKLDQSLSDIFRFIFNSTIGIGGLFDVASEMGLHEHKEDFGQTLAVWGVGQGPYLTLPLFGPSTVRDAPDILTSMLLHPLPYIFSPIYIPAQALNIVNMRASLLKASSIRDIAALDGYSFTREAYFQQRRYLIYDGNPPPESYDYFFDDDFFNMETDDNFF